MKTDKNSIIGIVLLGVLFIAFFWYTNKDQQAYMANQQHIKDSTEKANAAKITPAQKQAALQDSLNRDSASKADEAGNFISAAAGKEQAVSVENDVMKVIFTNKGARVKSVTLKKYHSQETGGQVVLASTPKDIITYNINTAPNHSASVNDLFFNTAHVNKNNDGSQTVSFTLQNAGGQNITHQYLIRKDSYLIDWTINMNGAGQLLTNNTMNFSMQSQPVKHERSIDYERRMSDVCFSVNNEFDYISSHTDEQFEGTTQWVSSVQQFFNTTLIAKNSFNGGEVHWARSIDSSNIIGVVTASLPLKVAATASLSVPMQLYYGPNDYKILQAAAPEMDKIVNLGRDLYSFVRPINKYIIMPVFNFFAGFISVYGWVIALLTMFIRLVTSPLVFRSYQSGARMKLLRPELDTLRKKFGDNQQGFAMEQMKLFREAGVNPLGGCLPLLLQIPIFFALYSFFNSNIALRGQNFLWSQDLSSFDNVIHFHNVWLIGDHISLFGLCAVITSFLISLYNMNMTPTDPNNPALKYMPYIYPVFMFFIFNSLPSALTWYYTVSNLITLGIQFTIQNYILDHEKIMAKMEEKRKAPKTQSKWQEKYQTIMESQKKMQQLKQKPTKK